MQLKAYEDYFENGHFYTSGHTMTIPERQQVIVTILEKPAQDKTMQEELSAIDEFIIAIKASDEEVPKFERIKLREVCTKEGNHGVILTNRNIINRRYAGRWNNGTKLYDRIGI